jgi:hypothetical protein
MTSRIGKRLLAGIVIGLVLGGAFGVPAVDREDM